MSNHDCVFCSPKHVREVMKIIYGNLVNGSNNSLLDKLNISNKGILDVFGEYNETYINFLKNLLSITKELIGEFL